MNAASPIVLVTGSTGFIGRALVEKLAQSFTVIGLDLEKPPRLPPGATFLPVDLSSEEGVQEPLRKISEEHGNRIASVVHLAAYFDLTGQPNPKYREVTVGGTERLLRAVRAFEVQQFIFSSTMLVHAPGRPGQKIDEDQPLEPKLPYRASKIEAEASIHAQRGRIPVVYLRPSGIYDEHCSNPFLAHQIAHIYERSPKSWAYPGDLRTGQSFLHLDDLTDAIVRLVERRGRLPPELPLLLGEPDVMSYGELQREVGRLIHGQEWDTWQVPRRFAKAGVWLEDKVLGLDPFICCSASSWSRSAWSASTSSSSSRSSSVPTARFV